MIRKGCSVWKKIWPWSDNWLQCTPPSEQIRVEQKGTGEPKTCCPWNRLSSEASIPKADGCFYAVCSWSTLSGHTNGQNSKPGPLLQEGSRFPWCFFGPDLPGKAYAWSVPRSLGRCGHLDGSHRCSQRQARS